MTKERREELKRALGMRKHALGEEASLICLPLPDGGEAELTKADLRDLLSSDERLEAMEGAMAIFDQFVAPPRQAEEGDEVTKKRRDELREALDDICGSGELRGYDGDECCISLDSVELRALLSDSERLERLTQWLERYALASDLRDRVRDAPRNGPEGFGCYTLN